MNVTKLIEAGDYNLSFNQKYLLDKLHSLDHYKFFLELFFSLIIGFFFIICMYYCIRYAREKILYSIKKTKGQYEKDVYNVFFKTLEYNLAIIEQIMKSISEDQSMGVDPRIISCRYDKDLLHHYKLIMGAEDYALYKKPYLVDCFAKCRTLLLNEQSKMK